MRIALLLVFVLWAGLPGLRGAEWALIKHDGREYVSFENMAQFYGLSDVRRVSSAGIMTFGTRSLRGESGSPDFHINNLKFVLSYPVIEIDGHLCVSRMDLVKVIEPVLRPSKIKGAEAVDTVILDPGHGGHDLGAQGGGGCEKDYALDTANRARLRLMQAGFKVVLTRSADVFVPLEERVAYANKFPNALFVSIHFNSSGNGTGIETYTLAPRGVPSMMADGPKVSDGQNCPGNVRDAENMALATATHASMIVRSHMYDRGIKRARFVVIRDVTIPGVLVEGGFLSNPYDARMIAQPAYRENLAAAIVDAVGNYRRAVSGSAAPVLTQNPNIQISDPPPIATPPMNTEMGAAAKTKTPEPKRGPRGISTDAAVAASAARVPTLTTN